MREDCRRGLVRSLLAVLKSDVMLTAEIYDSIQSLNLDLNIREITNTKDAMLTDRAYMAFGLVFLSGGSAGGVAAAPRVERGESQSLGARLLTVTVEARDGGRSVRVDNEADDDAELIPSEKQTELNLKHTLGQN